MSTETELLPAFGRYRLDQRLGGNMAEVYRATDLALGRTVVVKILTAEASVNDQSKARFLQEARLTGNLRHDNIINVYDFGEITSRPYLVMEFLNGEDLKEAIKNGRTGDLHNKVVIAAQVAKALQYIHSQGIVHRDIKPENIHICKDGVVKLMDFGIAKNDDLSLTQAGFILGTPYYMAPEQMMGKPLTPLVDVYAFGIFLFELMVGARPFEAASNEQIFYKIVHEPLNLTRLTTAGVPRAIQQLVERCTAKDPTGRVQTFDEIFQILASQIAATGERTPAARSKNSKKGWLAGGGIVAAVLILACIALILSNRAKPQLSPTLTTSTGEMVLVPAGVFLSGEKWQKRQLPAFYIDKTEVTNAAYQKYCAETGRSAPEASTHELPSVPVTGMTILEASEYAKWAGKRLPKLLEWEKAARGTDGRNYPWGNSTGQSRANLKQNGEKKGKMPVGSFPSSASPYGALDMAGNVWEFVDQLESPSERTVNRFARLLQPPPTRTELWYMICGGSYEQTIEQAISSDRALVPSRFQAESIGFRCVRDP